MLTDPRNHFITEISPSERSMIVPTREQSIGLSGLGIPASTPDIVLSAWPEAIVDYLMDPQNGPVILVSSAASKWEFMRLARKLRSLRIPFRWAGRG